MTLSRQEQI